MELLTRIAKSRPTGTTHNQELVSFIESYLMELGYEISKLPFACKVWEAEESFLTVEGRKYKLHVSPFSEAFEGRIRAVIAENLEQLKGADCEGKILFLTDELTQEALQPKDYPFYFPDEHKELIDCLEEKKPSAIIAVTGESSVCGLKPFYLIEDGNFHIPVASLEVDLFSEIADKVLDGELELVIASYNRSETAYQIIASKRVANSKGTIVICAHMDSKYNTPAALDNASGVAAMLLAAKGISSDHYNIDIVPFNSEEYYDPQGELLYLEDIKKNNKEISLLINIDTVAHVGSKAAVASFNLNEKEMADLERMIKGSSNMVAGQQWYAGDHAVFAFSGTKCLLIYASDLFEGCISYTHCPKDTIELVDEKLIENAADFICKLVNSYK